MKNKNEPSNLAGRKRMFRSLLSVLVALTTVFVIHAGNFPGSVPRFRQLSGGELFDTKIAVSSKDVLQRIEGFGDKGRAEYLFRNVTTDIALPLSVIPMLIVCTRQWRNRLRSRILQISFAFAPLVYLVFDLAENLVVYLLIAKHPDFNETSAEILPWLTIVKRIGAFTSLAVLGASTIAWILERYKARSL
jgi:uncharacterized membrane protein YhaH (DUF805 family)